MERDIYQGFWINQSPGGLSGATLTLNRQHGGLLIAFLALYVGASGRGLWKIVRFLLHYAFSSALLQDGLYHQRQAVLRNSGVSHETATLLLECAVAWRKNASQVQKRITPVVTIAAIYSMALTAASTFLTNRDYSGNADVRYQVSSPRRLPSVTVPKA